MVVVAPPAFLTPLTQAPYSPPNFPLHLLTSLACNFPLVLIIVPTKMLSKYFRIIDGDDTSP